MKQKQHKLIGIIGGMGADASARLYQLMIEMSRKEFGARASHEYPEIIIDSVPVPEFIDDDSRLKEAEEMIRDRVKKLEKLSPDCLGIACNTAHAILKTEEQRLSVTVPLVSMVKECVKEAKRKKMKTVGLLASPMTISSKMFEKAMGRAGIRVEIPNKQDIKKTGKLIKMIIEGKKAEAKREIIKIAARLERKKIDGLVLGCTELPLVFPKNCSFPVLNTLEILARALLSRYYRKAEI